ncbi:rho GTPase-activating protein 100F isoform X1 [Frankliniella occidentalis]|uniref:Rho GTPase-activating protein 100F isoform X1 n=1 Tax=Frankliniella occidentalis TaxID=133901 RepID=A0A9C6U312_FRAOC|nr:rho GTPase-activating protein 100F isoform X1 [Frankliniella occidentalis]
MPRSGSDQHLPRVEYQHPPQRTAHTMLRPGTLSHYGRYSSAAGQHANQHAGQHGYRRGRPSLDYASDTEATCSPSTRSSSSYYYYRDRSGAQGSSAASAALSRLGSATLSRGGSLRSNSLPRDHRGPGPISMGTLGTLSRSLVPSSPAAGRHQLASGRPPSAAHQLLDHHYDSDSALSAPDLPLSRRDRVRGRLPSSPSVFTADEYRAWLQRTPSTSAIYERIRANRDAALAHQRASRLTFSAENLNLLDRAREEGGSSYYGYRAPLTSTLDRHTFGAGRSPSASALSSVSSVGRSQSMRRMRQHLLELEASARHSGTLSRTSSSVVPESTRSRIMEINPSEFLKYKMDKAGSVTNVPGAAGVGPGDLLGDAGTPGVSGLLWVHLLAGRGLRASGSGSAATTPSTPSAPSPLGSGNAMRDLYCVLECDRVHKARTVVRTGDLVFDWDETFELDLVANRELDFLIYSWDPQYRHKLCYKGSVHLSSLLRQSPIHQLALKIEPRGTLYLRLRHTDPHSTFSRKHATATHPLLTRPGGKSLAATAGLLFGVDLESVVNRENISGGVPGGVPTSVSLATQGASQVPLIIRRCVEEIERRGLDIIGLYRLCGSATKKRILREAFERNARTVDLTPDNVPDINVITGVLKDYLRELPEPLFTKCLYQMMLDALTVCLPDDPEGNAKLMFSILDCLPKVNRATLIYLMDHLALVVSQSERNKMTPQNLAVCFGPVMMLQTEEGRELDFNQTISVLRYLLEIWPCKSGNRYQDSRGFDQGSDSTSDQHLLFREVLCASTLQSTSLTTSLGSQKPPPVKPSPAAHLTSLSRVQSSSPVVVSSPISDSSPSPSPPEEAEILRSIPKAGAAPRGPPPRIEPRRSLPKQGEHDVNGLSLQRQHSQPPGLPPRNASTLQRKWSANGNGTPPPRTALTSRPLPSPPVNSRPIPMAPSSAVYGGNGYNGSSVLDAVKNIESMQQHEAGSPNSSPRSVRNGAGLTMNLVAPDHSADRDTSPAASDQGDQLETPTSSTGTEDSRREGEAGERGTEGDEEASDDDDEDDRFRSGRGSSTSVVMRDIN